MTERIRVELKAVDKTRGAFAGVKRGLAGVRRSILSVKSAMIGMLSAVAISAAFRKLTGAALPFNRAIAEASTLIDGNVQQLDFLREAARKMAGEFGGTGTQQVNAFYKALSAGSKTVEDAAELLNVANKLAIGGVGDLTGAVGLLSTALNNFAASGLTAQSAADVLFTGVQFGVTTIGDLGGAMGRTAGLAADAGVSFEELVSATAALTTTGITTKEAITGVRAILAGVIKPSSEAAKMAKKLGIEFNAAALKSKGLAAFLDEVVVATGGSVEKMAQLFGGVEALAPVISLTGVVSEKFGKILAATADSAGVAETAYRKVADELEQRFRAVLGKVNVAVEQVGTSLLSILVPALEAAVSSMRIFFTALAVLTATQIPLMIRLLGTMATALLGVGVAAGTAMTALRVLGGPVGLLLGGIALLITQFENLGNAFRRFFPEATAAVETFTSAFLSNTKVLLQWMGVMARPLAAQLKVLSDEYVELETKLELNTEAFKKAIATGVDFDTALAISATRAAGFADRMAEITKEIAAVAKARDLLLRKPILPEVPTVPTIPVVPVAVTNIAALPDTLDPIIEKVKTLKELMEEGVVGAINKMADAFVQFVKGGKVDFRSLADSIISDLIRIQIRAAAIKLGGGGAGGFGGLLSAAVSAGLSAFGGGGNLAAANAGGPSGIGLSAPGFASGGSFKVGGKGGIDNNLIAFNATRGEHVTVDSPGKRRGDNRSEPVIQINNFTGEQVTTQRRQQGGQSFTEIAIGAMNDGIGQGDVDGTMKNRFGIAPQPIRR